MHVHVHKSSVDDDGADSSVDQFGLGGHAAPLSVETTLVMTNLCWVGCRMFVVIVVLKSVLVNRKNPQFLFLYSWCFRLVFVFSCFCYFVCLCPWEVSSVYDKASVLFVIWGSVCVPCLCLCLLVCEVSSVIGQQVCSL